MTSMAMGMGAARDEEADIRLAAMVRDVHVRQPIAAHGKALIDRNFARACRLDDLAEGREGGLGELFNLEFHACSDSDAPPPS